MKSTVSSPSCLKFLPQARSWGNSIQKIVRHRAWIDEAERVTLVAEALAQEPDLMALGVCRPNGEVLGLITRVNLFNLLGKPFGREILGKRTIGEILEFSGVFDAGTNLFTVAESLHDELAKPLVRYFLLKDAVGSFAGIFSSQDLLVYLSKITQEDIKLAASLQGRLVQAHSSVELHKGRIEAFSHDAQGVGGDFYHVKQIDPNRWFISLCDVSGKGVAASIITSLIWGMIRQFDFRHGLKALIKSLNEALIQTFHLEKHVTGVFMILNEHHKELVWADMGHGLAYIRRGRQILPLKGSHSNLPVGLEPELKPALYKTALKHGDQVLLFTDGLTEQVNVKGEEFSLEKVLRRFQKDPKDLLALLWRDLGEHRGPVPLQDDTTAVLLSLG